MKTREIDLCKLNSMTKYPSILTYHALGEKGMLKDEVQVPFEGVPLFATEKVDGTNARIVFMPDGTYIIGSREEFLHGKDDLIINPAQNIVPTILDHANLIMHSPTAWNGWRITVYYGEVYGHSIGAAAKNYTKNPVRGFRVFDAFEMRVDDAKAILDMPVEEISTWRENGGQPFYTVHRLVEVIQGLNSLASSLNNRYPGVAALPQMSLVPNIWATEVLRLPTGVAETHQWLKEHLKETQCSLDDTAQKMPEGIVVRTADRKRIAKIRYEDYQRTLRKK